MYNILIHFIPSISESFLRSSGNLYSPYMSNPYLEVSCDIIQISCTPFLAKFSASLIMSSKFLLLNSPLISGIAQNVHLLLHPSDILKYASG
ncbi:hypothetical protein D3C76_1478300 [compost metagenome]